MTKKELNKNYRQAVYNLLIFYALTENVSFSITDMSVARELENDVNDYVGMSFDDMLQDFATYYDVNVNDVKAMLEKGRNKLTKMEA